MSFHRMLGFVVAGLAGLSICASVQASTKARATGSIEVAGKSTPLEHLLAYQYGTESVTVLVSDVELPAPCTPLDAIAVVDSHPFNGVLFTVKKDLTLADSGNSLYHSDLKPIDGYGVIHDGLHLERSGTMAQGTLKTTVEVNGQKFAIDVALTIPTDPSPAPLAPRSIEGADSEPVQALRKLVDAVVDGDMDRVMEQVTADMRDQLESAGKDADVLFQFADFLLPVKMTITDVKIDGDHAVLTAQGETPACMTTDTSQGRIELIRESGTWKVAKMTWEG